MNNTAVILAGGKGSRIASVRRDIPKPMLDVCGKPVLERQILCLRENGVKRVVLITGHLAHVIRDYFGDGSRFDMEIQYIEEQFPMGTAGALFYLKELKDDFFLINGDIIFDVDLSRMLEFHRAKGGEVTVLAHPNNHPFDSALLDYDENFRVVKWRGVPTDTSRNCVNAGIHILSPSVLCDFSHAEYKSLDQDVIPALVAQGRVFAYTSPEYVHDMGTPERYATVCSDVAAHIPANKNLKHPQKAVFLDRDGTLNTYCGFVTNPDQIRLEAGAAEAVRRINQSGYLAVVVTNQPVIARGECTFAQLARIHGRLDYLLGLEGAYLDDIFVCPHHPDRGFLGEVVEYKTDCNCRKPKPGLLLAAAERYHIDLSASWMVGDSLRDMEAGRSAGCSPIFVGKTAQAENSFPSLSSVIHFILNSEP